MDCSQSVSHGHLNPSQHCFKIYEPCNIFYLEYDSMAVFNTDIIDILLNTFSV